MNEQVRRVLAGDKDAFRAVVAEYSALVRAFLGSSLNDPSVVDDLAQQTFIVAFEKLDQYDSSIDMALWLRGIARNELLRQLRRTRQYGKAIEKIKAQILEAVCERVSRLSEGDEASALEKLRRCVAELPPHARGVVEARYLARERVTSIAARLQTTVTAISSLLLRARELLRGCMEAGAHS